MVLLAPQRCENRVVPYFDLEHGDPAADGTGDALARPDTELVTVPWTAHDLPVLAVDILVGRGGEHCAGDPSVADRPSLMGAPVPERKEATRGSDDHQRPAFDLHRSRTVDDERLDRADLVEVIVSRPGATWQGYLGRHEDTLSRLPLIAAFPLVKTAAAASPSTRVTSAALSPSNG